MKTMFVVEADTEYRSLFAYQVTSDAVGEYKRVSLEPSIVSGGWQCAEAEFFGQLRRALVTKSDLLAAPPINLKNDDPTLIEQLALTVEGAETAAKRV
jgi:hypothetical protein